MPSTKLIVLLTVSGSNMYTSCSFLESYKICQEDFRLPRQEGMSISYSLKLLSFYCPQQLYLIYSSLFANSFYQILGEDENFFFYLSKTVGKIRVKSYPQICGQSPGSGRPD